MAKLVIVRHGQSVWNKENRFEGCVDIGLTDEGVEEAINAGQFLKDYKFDSIYISHMIRSIHSLQLILHKNSHNIS